MKSYKNSKLHFLKPLVKISGLLNPKNQKIYTATLYITCVLIFGTIPFAYMMQLKGQNLGDTIIASIGLVSTFVVTAWGIGTHLSNAETLNLLNRNWPNKQISFEGLSDQTKLLIRNVGTERQCLKPRLYLMLSTLAYGINVGTKELEEFVEFLEGWVEWASDDSSINREKARLCISFWQCEEHKSFCGAKHHKWSENPDRRRKTIELLRKIVEIFQGPAFGYDGSISLAMKETPKCDLRLFLSSASDEHHFGLMVVYTPLLNSEPIDTGDYKSLGTSTEHKESWDRLVSLYDITSRQETCCKNDFSDDFLQNPADYLERYFDLSSGELSD